MELESSEQDMVALAMAITSLHFPGFLYAYGEIADKMGARGTFEAFRRLRADQFPIEPVAAAAAAAYRDDSFAERVCDHCGRHYRGPAVYCRLECALGDAQ